ncbi:MAG: alpha/beta hydrolase [Actinomycetota bacterium]|nr:alpha/beta hydrolase [Actinomycetota bacterium]
MRLHVHEWGDPVAPPIVCLHGISAHGRRFRQLAEDRLAARFRIVAPDLRGHGDSRDDPPWDIENHLGDLDETLGELGIERATWLGHSFGGRLVAELAAREPERIERAVLLDPALQILPHVGHDFAEQTCDGQVFDSIEEAVDLRASRSFTTPREFLEEDTREQLVQSSDGRLRFRFCRSATVTGYSEMCTPPPPPETLAVPTLIVYSPAFGLVRQKHVAAYGALPNIELVAVSGGHIVYWDAFEETAAAIDRFLG